MKKNSLMSKANYEDDRRKDSDMCITIPLKGAKSGVSISKQLLSEILVRPIQRLWTVNLNVLTNVFCLGKWKIGQVFPCVDLG